MKLYRTSDGKIFGDEDKAVNHSIVLEYNTFGDFDHCLKIDRSNDGTTWI